MCLTTNVSAHEFRRGVVFLCAWQPKIDLFRCEGVKQQQRRQYRTTLKFLSSVLYRCEGCLFSYTGAVYACESVSPLTPALCGSGPSLLLHRRCVVVRSLYVGFWVCAEENVSGRT